MRNIFKILSLCFLLILLSTCEFIDVFPTTKVETGQAIPLATSILIEGKIIEISGYGNDDCGFCYATHDKPEINDKKISIGKPIIGSFSTVIEGLNSNTRYYIRAYCNSSKGISYGNTVIMSTQDGVTVLTTTELFNVTTTSVSTGGKITSDGGAQITARGVVWDIKNNPTTDNHTGITIDGKGMGNFTSEIEELNAKTTYYIRAYATNDVGTVYGNQIKLTTSDGTASLTTAKIENVSLTSATSGGEVLDDGGSFITAKGVVWSTSEAPTIEQNDGKTIDGAGIGKFMSNLTNLTPNFNYYVRAYATNSVETRYGNQVSFTTGSTNIVMRTKNISDIKTTSAQSGGIITDDGSAPIIERGIVWNTAANPTIEIHAGKTNNGTGMGEYIAYLTGLTANTTYFVRAYANNKYGTQYGEQMNFTTYDGSISLSTTSVSNIKTNSAISGGNITSDGGSAITARGVVWDIQENPTTEQHQGISNNGTGSGTWISNITELEPNTSYYLRAYATNNAETKYGNQVNFTTPDGMLSLTTASVSDITAISAMCGGFNISDGGSTITAKGVVWSLLPSPSVENHDGITKDRSGTGIYNSYIDNLTPNSTYYVRAYATNSLGTQYGDQLSCTTLDGVISLTTDDITKLSPTSIVYGGNITSDGGAAITTRGVVWSTSENPTLENNEGKTSNGTGTGNFSDNITAFATNTTYYLRAYAVNITGTYYGNQVTFTMPAADGTFGSVTYNGYTYKTVYIGGKEWLAENLRTTRYNDGTEILLVTNAANWSSLNTPAYCWYDNNENSYKDTYGALYNWYAVNTGKLAPPGWHVATDEEWTALVDFVGGTDAAGTYLKSKSGWYNGGNGIDYYGFSAPPGGYRRSDNGNFSISEFYGYWWSATSNDTNTAWRWDMYYSTSAANRNYNDKKYGYSVRCVRD
jgi:uncharacterized protein (TIGR02145 family)